jgi:hypothetical protein
MADETVKVVLRVPPALWDDLSTKAADTGRSKNSAVLEAIKEWTR